MAVSAMSEGAAANGLGTSRVLSVLARRRRVGRVIGALCAIVVLAFLGFVGLRARALSQEFPEQERVTYHMGEDISCPGTDGVTFLVDDAAWLSDAAAKSLCPDSYENAMDSFGGSRFFRIDFTVQNDGTESFAAGDLVTSSLTLGNVYGNVADLMATGEAFPGQVSYSVDAGGRKAFSIIYSVARITLTPEQWDRIEDLPAAYQFSVWPKVMTVSLS